MSPRSMRVLYLGPATHVGGEEMSTLSLASGLIARGHHAAYASSGGPFLSAFTEAGVPTHILPVDGRRPLGVWRGSRSLRRFLADNPFDIVHSQEVFTTVIADLARKVPSHLDTRLIYHYRGVRPERMGIVSAVIPRISEYVITNAEVNRRSFLDRGVDASKVETIYNGFDWAVFDRECDVAGLREEWGVPADAPLAGVVARLMPIKGHTYLLRAMPRILERVPRAHVVIVGDGPLRESLESEARELGVASSVHFLGFRTDVPAILSALDLLVLPSVGEPFGRVLVEAGAAGLAAVSTRVGGTIEILEDGVTGHFVPDCDPAPLAERVADLLGDLDAARRMGAVASERVRGIFGIERMLDRTIDVYRQVLDGRTGDAR